MRQARRGYSGPPVRPSSAAALASSPPCSAALRVLVVGQGGRLAARTATTRLRSSQPAGRAGDGAPVVVAKPLAGNGFAPAQIYRARSAGVVTIYLATSGCRIARRERRLRAPGFVVGRDGTILTSAHVITTAGSRVAPGRRWPRTRSTSSSRTATACRRRIVGYDLFDDVGVDPRRPARRTVLARSRSATRAGWSSASPSPRSAARSATPTRSRSASSRRSTARSRR